jgi:hypothetical protein
MELFKRWGILVKHASYIFKIYEEAALKGVVESPMVRSNVF